MNEGPPSSLRGAWEPWNDDGLEECVFFLLSLLRLCSAFAEGVEAAWSWLWTPRQAGKRIGVEAFSSGFAASWSLQLRLYFPHSPIWEQAGGKKPSCLNKRKSLCNLSTKSDCGAILNYWIYFKRYIIVIIKIIIAIRSKKHVKEKEMKNVVHSGRRQKDRQTDRLTDWQTIDS